jgi:hypothetical protein
MIAPNGRIDSALLDELVKRVRTTMQTSRILKVVYEFKQRLVRLLLIKHRMRRQCRRSLVESPKIQCHARVRRRVQVRTGGEPLFRKWHPQADRLQTIGAIVRAFEPLIDLVAA